MVKASGRNEKDSRQSRGRNEREGDRPVRGFTGGRAASGAKAEGRRPSGRGGKPFERKGDGGQDRKMPVKPTKRPVPDAPISSLGEDIPWVEGRNPVIEALKSGRTVEKLLIAKGSQEGSIRQIVSMARDKGIVISEVDRAKLDSMSETGSHQGVIAMVSPYKYVEVDEILDYASRMGEVPLLLVLDEIHDPHNLGSVMRTAEAAGVHGIIISKRRAVGLTPTVAKASAGAIEYMKVAKVTNISQTIGYLKEKGLWIIGTDMDGEKPYYEADFTGPVALVVGNEGEGMGRLVKDSCDYVVKLPMKGKIPSLNAAVSGAVVIYEALKQRILKR